MTGTESLVSPTLCQIGLQCPAVTRTESVANPPLVKIDCGSQVGKLDRQPEDAS